MKTYCFNKRCMSLILAVLMMFTILPMSAMAADVFDNDHDRISIDTASPLHIVWESDDPTAEGYHAGRIVSSDPNYYPSTFYLYIQDGAYTITGGTISSDTVETEGGTRYTVSITEAGEIIVTLRDPASGDGVYTLTFSAPMGLASGGAITGSLMGYLPLGQYDNREGWGSPYVGSTTTPKVLGGFSSTGETLGAAGGYVQYELSGVITNDPANPYGVDFIVYGNAFAGNPEAGAVQVRDAATQQWYELAGSLYYDAGTARNTTVTYVNTGSAIQLGIGGADPAAWGGRSTWFPTWDFYGDMWRINNAVVPVEGYSENGNSLTYTGITLVKDTDDTGDYTFGYADVHPNGGNYGTAANPYAASASTSGGDGFDLSWAVDANGVPVKVESIDAIRVYTASLLQEGAETPTATVPGIFGETSTEVCGIYVATPSSASVGTTAAPTIMLDGEDISGYKKVEEFGQVVVYDTEEILDDGSVITVTDATGANVYINSTNGTSYTATSNNPIRIIVQADNAAPYIVIIK